MMLNRLVSSRALIACALIVSSSCYVIAQQPSMMRVRGTIENIDGKILHIKSRDGADLTVRMTQDIKVIGVVKISLSDVKVGSYIGVSSVPDSENGHKAIGVHVFLESMRGTAEGSRPWDLRPNSSMTNGALDQTVKGNDGHTLVVKYKDGEKKVVVTPDTAIAAYVPGELTDIKVGAKIFAIVTKQPDGSLETSRLNVGRDGITPPM
jgi:hypothetical protein